ncbi:carbohydrate binding domain-containing protein [Microbacterium sp. NPDC058342]|uniref:carbohydrate binding domain-containing protein n=1 Tax=Microbacterium sp. NPDC058342 TaxID=3346454 RepID=UPI0036696859
MSTPFRRRTLAAAAAVGVIAAGLVPLAASGADGSVQTLFDFEDGIDRHIQWEAAGAGIQDVTGELVNAQNPASSKTLSYGFDLTAAPGYGGIGFEFAAASQDWSAYDGVQFWLYGDGGESSFQVELLDAPAPESAPGTYERWDLIVPSGAAGWRLVELTWDRFSRAADFQDDGAADDGVLELTAVRGILFPANDGAGTVKIDDIALFSSDGAVPPTVGTAAAAVDVVEGDDAVITVRLSRASETDVAVDYATVDGTARAPADYAAASGTLTIPAGATSADLVIPTVDDDEADGNAQFAVELSAAVGATLGAAKTTVTVRDDEVAAGEPAPDYTTIVDFESDLLPGDPADAPPLGWFTAQGAGNVPSFERADGADRPDAAEGNTVLDLGLDSTSWAVLIDAFTDDGSAWHAQDWSAHGGFGFWMKGTNSGAPMFVDILDNRTPDSEIDDAERFSVRFADDWNGWRFVQFPFEQFTRKNVNNGAPDDGLTLSEMHGFGIGIEQVSPRVSTTIRIDDVALYGEPDPDRPMLLNFARSIFPVTEGEQAVVTVSLNRPSEEDVSFSYRTEDAVDRTSSEDPSATAGRDYVATSGEVTIPAGARTATLRIPTIDDGKHEVDETFLVRIHDAVGADLPATTAGRVSIVDDEDPADFAHIIDDFEQGIGKLSPQGGARLAARETVSGSDDAYPGQQRYENVLDIVGAGGYAHDFAQPRDLSGAEGIGFWYRGRGDGRPVIVSLKDDAAPATGPEGWTLAWADEFEGEAGTPADPRLWTYETGGWGWGNDELQYYTDSTDNAAHDGDGNLLITTRKVEDPQAGGLECWYGPCQYTSARLVTENKAEFLHGRIEARAQLPEGKAGIWPAFWALGADFRQVGWPGTGEIDIMEYVGKLPNEVFGTLHGPGYSGGGSIGDIHDYGENIGGQWLTFAVEWEPEEIRWYAQRDGEEPVMFFRATPETVAPNDWVFEHPFFLIANMAVGGNFGGPLAADLEFPQEYRLDYVRVYQEPDTAERFEAGFTDDAVGWRFVELPFDEFRRAEAQVPGAPDDGLSLTAVRGYGITGGEGDTDADAGRMRLAAAPAGSVSIDRVQTLASLGAPGGPGGGRPGQPGDDGGDGAAAEGSGGSLPQTGADLPTAALWAGLLLLVGGAVLMRVQRRRRVSGMR